MMQTVFRPVPSSDPVQRAGDDWGAPDPVLLSRNAFEALLAREFACADRYGHTHAVIEIEAGPRGSRRRTLLLDAFARRLRFVDAAGLLPGGRIGVLVLFTEPASIQRLVRNLCSATEGECNESEWRARFHHGKARPEVDEVGAEEHVALERTPRIQELVGGGGGLAVRRPSREVRDPKSRSTGDSQPREAEIPERGLSAKELAGCEPAGILALTSRPLPVGKRLLDIAAASVGLLVLSPLLVAIGALVALTSEGPIFYSQERTGRGLRRFRMFKFRTMHVRSESQQQELVGQNEMSGPLFKMREDPRRTRIGGLLRRLSLDELPQLWNVLKGDMTLIGPRALSPLPAQYAPWQLRRFDVTPGLACTWQAESRGSTDFDEWMRYDLRYLDHGVTALGDLRILLGTARAVITCAGSR